MANHKSAKKRAKQTIVKTEQNKARNSEVKSAIKDLRVAIEKKDKAAALKLLPEVQSLLAKLAQTSAINKLNAARRTSRLSERVARI
ncbi:MAG: 30S ribosomal protein S20 [Bacteriovoracaceae bacterium]